MLNHIGQLDMLPSVDIGKYFKGTLKHILYGFTSSNVTYQHMNGVVLSNISILKNIDLTV